MLRTDIDTLNYLAGLILTQLANAAIPALVAVALTGLLAWHKRWNAASRYCAWWLTLALLVGLPFVPNVGRRPLPAPAPDNLDTDVVAASSPLPLAPVPALPVRVAFDSAPIAPRPSPAVIFLFCWMAAACLQLTRVVRGFLRGLQLKRESRPAPQEIEALFQNLLLTATSRRSVSLAVSDGIQTPVVLGYLRPQVLLPETLLGYLDASELEHVLLHELAHLERWDDWSIAVQRVIEAIGIFHPLIAWLSRRMDTDREMAADDHVTARCDSHQYAACLTRIAEMRDFGSPSLATAPLLLERKPQLLSRVESLLDRTRGHLPRISRLRLALAFTCAAAVGTAAAFTPGLLSAPAAPQPLPMQIPAPAAPPQPAVPPKAGPEPVPEHARRTDGGVSSIRVTGNDGSSSNFGSWSGNDEKGEPGTITFWSGDKRYVIRDPGTLSEASKILAPMEELGRKQAALGEQQAKLGEQQSLLGEKQQALVDTPLDDAAMKRLEDQLRQMEEQLKRIDVEKQLKTAREAMEKLGDLQSKLGEMQSRMASEQGLLGEKQGELGHEQGKLGAEQGRLGRLQGELGAQQGRESRRAQKQLEDLIRRAQERGLAQPLH